MKWSVSEIGNEQLSAELNEKSVAELLAYAAARDIELGNRWGKQRLIDTIYETLVNRSALSAEEVTEDSEPVEGDPVVVAEETPVDDVGVQDETTDNTNEIAVGGEDSEGVPQEFAEAGEPSVVSDGQVELSEESAKSDPAVTVEVAVEEPVAASKSSEPGEPVSSDPEAVESKIQLVLSVADRVEFAGEDGDLIESAVRSIQKQVAINAGRNSTAYRRMGGQTAFRVKLRGLTPDQQKKVLSCLSDTERRVVSFT